MYIKIAPQTYGPNVIYFLFVAKVLLQKPEQLCL